MPHYYFDIEDRGRIWTDDIGEDLTDLSEAREHAIAILPDILRESPLMNDPHVVECRVRDAHGILVYSGRLTFNELQSELPHPAKI